MQKINAAIQGYGNIGKAALEALEAAPDFAVCGILSRTLTNKSAPELSGHHVVKTWEELPTKPEVVIVCAPSLNVHEVVPGFLAQGISTVDAFDMHGRIPALHQEFDALAKANHCVSVLAAGWDPGSDSVVRALLQAAAPQGLTETNFGPGMSMGHSVAVRSLPGVKDALSMTIPQGSSIHRRMVYVELLPGYDFEQVKQAILTHEYFVHDQTKVQRVPCVRDLVDMGHGVSLQRRGVSGKTHNQVFEFTMRINNPALTAQLMIACARAGMRQKPGCYTMIELPPVDLLPGARQDWIKTLV